MLGNASWGRVAQPCIFVLGFGLALFSLSNVCIPLLVLFYMGDASCLAVDNAFLISRPLSLWSAKSSSLSLTSSIYSLSSVPSMRAKTFDQICLRERGCREDDVEN
jgi:hypothetical protein